MSDTVKLVPPLEKVRLRKLTATDGTVHVGVEIQYREILWGDSGTGATVPFSANS